MKLTALNIDGTKGSVVEISDKILKMKVNYKLIKSVLDWQLNHAKPRTAKTKQRNQISGSTRKIVAQKEVVVLDMQVKKLHYLLVEVLHMDLKAQFIKTKRLTKKLES